MKKNRIFSHGKLAPPPSKLNQNIFGIFIVSRQRFCFVSVIFNFRMDGWMGGGSNFLTRLWSSGTGNLFVELASDKAFPSPKTPSGKAEFSSFPHPVFNSISPKSERKGRIFARGKREFAHRLLRSLVCLKGFPQLHSTNVFRSNSIGFRKVCKMDFENN